MNNFSIKQIINKLDLNIRKRMPLVHQTEAAECSLACLAMICGYFGKTIDLVTLRQKFNMSARGTTLAGVISIADELGFVTRPLSLNIDELGELRTPCILHWEFNHFIVLVRMGKKHAVIHDPARGRRQISLIELSNSFTGVALEVWPGSSFTTSRAHQKFKLSSLTGNIYGLKNTLVKIFCLSFIIESINLAMPVGTQLVMDHVIPAADQSLLTLICIGLALFLFLKTAVSIFRSWTSLIMGTLINVQWQAGLFNHLLRLPLSYFERRKLGDIQSRFSSLEALKDIFVNSIIGAIIDSIMVICMLVMMILYGGWLTWVVATFTAIYVGVRLITYNRYRQLSEELLVRRARASSYFMETLYGIATVKMQGMIERRSTYWLNLEIDSINTDVRVKKMDMIFGGINTFIAACDQILILWLGTSLIIDNQMTIGMFVAFGSFRSQFTDRMGSLTEFLLQLRMMSLHNERIADIALHLRDNRKPDIPAKTKMRPAALVTKNLSYRYDSQSPPVFSNLNLSIKSGESVALVGSSGVGKTTLMKVLCGLFQPDSGSVEVDGLDINKLGINNYHKMIACVMQEDKLFSGSIRENICGFTEEVDEEWMRMCANTSYLHDVIMQMPMGYETLIGELGEGLSGGQKQRLLIARAIYKKPDILFLDEATSALDKDSETAVNDAIKSLNITRIIIAHRESTISSADRVINLNVAKKTNEFEE